jgi:hypothetical protein
MGPNIYGFYYTHANLCATFCTAYDVKGWRAVVAVRRHRYGDIGFSRSAKMGVSAIVGLGNKSISTRTILTFFEQDDNTRPSHSIARTRRRPRLRRSRQTVSKKKRSKAEWPYLGRLRPGEATPARWPATTRSMRTCSTSPA